MNENQLMFLEEHRDFLRQTAMAVFELVLMPNNMTYFRKQVEAFSRKNEEHQKELQEIKKDYEANSELQEAAKKLDDQIKNAPVNENGLSDLEMDFDNTHGWGMLENFKDYIYYDGDFWGPSAQTIDLVTFLVTPPSSWMFDLPKMPNDAEKLICSYTLLSAIHDKYIKEKPIFFDELYYNQYPQHWVVKIEQRCDCFNAISGGFFDSVKDTQAWIKRALEEIKADLAGIGQAETGQKIEPGKEYLLESIRKAYEEVEKLTEVDVNFDKTSDDEINFAEAAVIEYLTKRFGEQDDSLGNWPRDWHECPEAFELYKAKIKEYCASKAKASLEEAKRMAEAQPTQKIIPEEKPSEHDQIETFDDLYCMLGCDLQEYGCVLGQTKNAAIIAGIGIRRKYADKGFSLPEIPENPTATKLMDWCTTCEQTIRAGKPEQKIKPGKKAEISQWNIPKGYIGSKTIVADYNLPRSTLQGWAERDNPKVKKDPQTKENYYPQKWFDGCWKKYKPRSKA